jgi:hypothetical protein
VNSARYGPAIQATIGDYLPPKQAAALNALLGTLIERLAAK